MNAGEPAGRILELPGKPTLWRTTDLSPRYVELPYLGRMPHRRMLVVLLLAIPAMLLVSILYPALLFSAASKFNDAPFNLIEILLAPIIGVPLLLISGEAVLMALRGVFHHGYHVGFDAEKFWHFQLSNPIAFSDIKGLDVLNARGDPMVLRIMTDQPIGLRFTSVFNRRRQPRRGGSAARFTFSSEMLTGDKVLLIDAISHLVESNGGVIARKEILSLWFEILVPWI